jgi:hypothetical protein
MKKTMFFPGTLCLGVAVALTAAWGCQREQTTTPSNLAATPSGSANSTITTFVHPGVVNSQASLALVAGQVNAGDATRKAGYDKVTEFMNNNALPTSFPSVVYAKASGGTNTENQIRRDCILAYACALRWVKTGDATYAGQAKQILNGYANNFQRYEPDAASGTQPRQTYLEASWVAPSFVAAAEIIRYYQVNGQGAGWSATDISKFDGFLNNLKNNYVNNVPGAISDINNWQASYCYAKMALGVWFNSTAVYDSGYDYMQAHMSDFIRADGNVNECGRDCHHLQYTLCALTYAAETARIQGNTALYGFNSQAIKNGWGKYEESLEGSTQCKSCQDASDNAIFPAIETAYNYYGTTKLQTLRDREDPYGLITPDNTFLGFTSFTHRSIGQTR